MAELSFQATCLANLKRKAALNPGMFGSPPKEARTEENICTTKHLRDERLFVEGSTYNGIRVIFAGPARSSMIKVLLRDSFRIVCSTYNCLVCILCSVALQMNRGGTYDAAIFAGCGFSASGDPLDSLPVMIWLSEDILENFSRMTIGDGFELRNVRVSLVMNTFMSVAAKQVKINKGVGLPRLMYPVDTDAYEVPVEVLAAPSTNDDAPVEPRRAPNTNDDAGSLPGPRGNTGSPLPSTNGDAGSH